MWIINCKCYKLTDFVIFYQNSRDKINKNYLHCLCKNHFICSNWISLSEKLFISNKYLLLPQIAEQNRVYVTFILIGDEMGNYSSFIQSSSSNRVRLQIVSSRASFFPQKVSQSKLRKQTVFVWVYIFWAGNSDCFHVMVTLTWSHVLYLHFTL